MLSGESLLIEHNDNKGMYCTLILRRQQLEVEITDTDSFIESVALQGIIPHESRFGGNAGSRTEWIAMNLDSKMNEHKMALESYIARLNTQISDTKEKINQYEAVYAGLTKMEQWLTTLHYIEGKSIESIANVPSPSGAIISATSLRRMKRKLIDKVNSRLNVLSSQKI